MGYLIVIGSFAGLFGVIYFLLGFISGNDDDDSRMAIAFGITAFVASIPQPQTIKNYEVNTV